MKNTILIEIKNGQLSAVLTNTEHVTIKVLDHDNADPCFIEIAPDSVLTARGLKEYEEKNKMEISEIEE